MAQGDRTCLICGAKYNYCSKCPGAKPDETWKNLYCSKGCKEVFELVSAYKNGHINASEAKMKLKSPNIDLSKKGQFADEYKSVVDELIAQESEKKTDEVPKNKKFKKENDK